MNLTLLHLCDSLFPLGGFAHSDGLETATADGRISTAGDLRQWIDACLDCSLARLDGPAVLLAVRAFKDGHLNDLDALDAEVHALRPASAARAASRAMGGRLLKTWLEIYPNAAMEEFLSSGGPGRSRISYTLPVAFGIICGAQGVDPASAVESFLYTRLAAIVSSAMRLMPIGQREAHMLLAAVLARVPKTVAAIQRSVDDGHGIGSFAPVLDLAAMSQQYLHSRLFLS
jgi:urease accessory protein